MDAELDQSTHRQWSEGRSPLCGTREYGMSENVTDRQRDILRHSLGIKEGDTPYRNHFVTGPGSDDYDDCCALVEQELMIMHRGSEISGGDPIFVVTSAGQAVARGDNHD